MSRKVRFFGFEIGANISHYASQGGVKRSPATISAWTIPGDHPWRGDAIDEALTVTVETVLPGGDAFAPLGVEFRITVSGSAVGEKPANFVTEFDPTWDKITYVLHTGDTGTYKNDWVGHPSHRSKAFQYGQNPGHVYSTPGTYTPRVYVYDEDGKWGTYALDPIVVADPIDAFDAASTIVVSKDNIFTGCPHEATLPAGNKVTTLSAAFDRANAIDSTLPKGFRICAKAGELYEEFYQGEINIQYANGRILFDTWGGSDPITYDETSVSDTGSENYLFLRVQGGGDNGPHYAFRNWVLKFNGYNPETGCPYVSSYEGIRTGLDNVATMVPQVGNFRCVYDNVSISGLLGRVFGSADSPAETPRSGAIFINDCSISGNADFLVMQASNIFMLGTKYYFEYGWENGYMGDGRGGGAVRTYLGHPTIREKSTHMFYMRASFMEGRGAWSGQNSGMTGPSGQLILRLSVGPNADKSHKKYYICDSVIEGSMTVGQTKGIASGHQKIFENCVLIYSPMEYLTQSIVVQHGGGKVFRNNQFLVLNTIDLGKRSNTPSMATKNFEKFELFDGKADPNYNTGRFRRFFEVAYQPQSRDKDMISIHNTFVMLRQAENIAGTFEIRNTANLVVEPTVFLRDEDGKLVKDENGKNIVVTPAVTEPIDSIYNIIEGNNVLSMPHMAGQEGPDTQAIDLPSGMRILDVWQRTTWEGLRYILSSDVADGADTPIIPYPDDWNGDATVQADYAGTFHNASVLVNFRNRFPSYGASNEIWNELDNRINNSKAANASMGKIAVTYGATGLKITNNSGKTWPAGITISISLDRGTTLMDPDRLATVDQTELKLYRPVTPQALDAGVKSTLFDFNRQLRPNAGFAISPTSGTNAAGAILPAQD
jgi:hypothetical protein